MSRKNKLNKPKGGHSDQELKEYQKAFGYTNSNYTPPKKKRKKKKR